MYSRNKGNIVNFDGKGSPLIITEDPDTNVRVSCVNFHKPNYQRSHRTAKIENLIPNVYGDVGPYKFLTPTINDAPKKPSENLNWIKIQHQKTPPTLPPGIPSPGTKFQNIMDTFLPYYKACPICPRGTPHCGYFGHTNKDEFNNADFSESDVALTFNFESNVMVKSMAPTDISQFLEVNCNYSRRCELQHCCRGVTKDWCKDTRNLKPQVSEGRVESMDIVQNDGSLKKEWVWKRGCTCHSFDVDKNLVESDGSNVYKINLQPRSSIPDTDELEDKTCCQARLGNKIHSISTCDPASCTFDSNNQMIPIGSELELKPIQSDCYPPSDLADKICVPDHLI